MNVLTNRIEYTVGDVVHRGYLAYDDELIEPRPGVLIVHEWWGLNDTMIRRAHMLAELGYVAVAVDMYGAGQVAADADQAGSLMEQADWASTLISATGYPLLLFPAYQFNAACYETNLIPRCTGKSHRVERKKVVIG